MPLWNSFVSAMKSCNRPCRRNDAMVALGLDAQEAVIDLCNVTRRFGATVALNAVTLRVPRGAVFGLVGANGAGKTTLIRHVLGLLKAQAGSVRVFGRDPVADPVGVL